MQKITILTFLVLFSICTVKAQTEKASTPAIIKVEVKDMPEIKMIYYEFTGPYMQSFSKFANLMDYIKENNIPLGEHALAIFYDDPSTVAAEKLRSEAGFMVKAPIEPKAGYLYKKIPAGKAVSAHYKSYDEIMPAYEAISKYIADNNFNTAPYSIEIYYSSDPTVVDAEILMMIIE